MSWMGKWRRWPGEVAQPQLLEELDIYMRVTKAQAEWERARLMFDEALGQDQIDYAIFILEAAERSYQIQLKAAKVIGLDRSRLPIEE